MSGSPSKPISSLTTGPCVTANQILVPGEVLMTARGSKPRAAAFIQSERATVASSQFLVLRPSKEATAEYLCWFLNQPGTIRYFRAHLKGSGIPFLPKETLLELRVPLPPLPVQEKIVQIHKLSNQEQRIMGQLQEKRKELVGVWLQELIQRCKEPKLQEHP
jgi:restriction endonuclease S subunit